MELHEGRWIDTIVIDADTKTELAKRTAAVKRLLKQMDKERKKARREPGEGSIYKRADGMWVGRLELEPGPDGKRVRSKPVYSTDRNEVVKKLDTLKGELSKGLKQLDQKITVAEWLEYWIVHIAPKQVRPHVLRSYRAAIRTRIIPAIGKRKLAQLEPKDVRFMHDHILSSTYKRGGEDVPYSTRSVEEAHNVLSAALDDAKEEGGLVHRNVAEKVSKPLVLSKSHGSLSSEQARKVLLVGTSEKHPLVTRWAAGLMLGGRQGELLGLQVDRINFEEGSLDLSWQLEWLPLKKGADPDAPDRFDVDPGFEHIPLWRGAALTRPKTTASQRVTPLPAPLAAILKVYLEQVWTPNPWGLVWVVPPNPQARIWKDERPVSDAVDLKEWKAIQRRAGIAKPVDVHAMRGTTATLLLEAKVDAKVIQSILGHASVITTRGYQQVDLTLARSALGNLHGLLEISGS
ncbi:tyrosine-type recombinase/integrase [Nocardia cyriacigeorgica]|uniref:tyrosine-type recombinase/integrase n=1 Tax=Nocardia cyriacigeorgica TaxID=135487 RepID=UPI0024552241|nr:site-specific integrase [Nocardia cyriacigeorgica]